MISASALTILVFLGLGLTALTPLLLLALLMRDWKRGELW